MAVNTTKMLKNHRHWLPVVVLLLAATAHLTSPAAAFAGGFSLAEHGKVADLCVSPQDARVVQIAAGCLADDVQRVSGMRPLIKHDTVGPASHMVLIGTLGVSPLIDRLVSQGKLHVQTIRGQWESYVIATVTAPLPGVKSALVIAGSDRRGTAYGVFTLSQQIGVSPWYWWGDVTPRHKSTLLIPTGTVYQGPPAVKYRGIFLNDEDWGLRPWASRTFDPQTGNIGPKTYVRIFELLLRLKANFLWPAMHPGTTPFNNFPENKILADDYGIVMGSSHAEPMLRNNVGEWKQDYGDYNYAMNAERIRQYWQQRVHENERYENVYTVGMRGIHDSSMEGPKDTPSRVALLQQVIADQRRMLAQEISPDLTKVPQLFANYKEVLTLYEAGLKLPQDVTVMWSDDNFGYITRLSSAEERKRSGGAGVYYHVSYWGAPEDYLWLCTTPPALIWEEMHKAYDAGARKVWVLNVGDLKPAEMDIDFFLSLAWNPRQSAEDFMRRWVRQQFGLAHAQAIVNILTEYYRLGYARKPEQMDNAPLSSTAYGDEAQQRLDAYAHLTQQADAIALQMPPDRQDAFYEMILYSVHCADLQNRKFIESQKSRLYAQQGRASAQIAARAAQAAYDRIQSETAFYNERVAGGKWRGMMSADPRRQPAYQPPAPPPPASGKTGFGVAVEGSGASLPEFNGLTQERHFVDVFRTGSQNVSWTAVPQSPWIRMSAYNGMLGPDARIWVTIDWAHAPQGAHVPGSIVFHGHGMEKTVTMTLFHPTLPLGAMTGFIESGGALSMDAGHFTHSQVRGQARWQIIPGLGRTGHAVTVLPTTLPSMTDPAAIAVRSPEIEYATYFFSTGNVKTTLYAVPTWPLSSDYGSRIAIAFDDQTPQIVDMRQDKAHWSVNVLQAASLTTVSQTVPQPGVHILRIWMVDSGVALDKIVIDTGGVQPSYFGPPETLIPSGRIQHTQQRNVSHGNH